MDEDDNNKDESLQSVRSSSHDTRRRDVDTHGTAGPQVQGARYGKNYARNFSAGSKGCMVSIEL
jgi:hypothetical protein